MASAKPWPLIIITWPTTPSAPIGHRRPGCRRAQGQPDLLPYTPAGYEALVVPTSIAGTYTAGSLYAGHATYFDWYFTNGGNATAAGSFYVDLFEKRT